MFCHILAKYPLCKIFSLEDFQTVSNHFNKSNFSLDDGSIVSIPRLLTATGVCAIT